jgi:hypothetical protein
LCSIFYDIDEKVAMVRGKEEEKCPLSTKGKQEE